MLNNKTPQTDGQEYLRELCEQYEQLGAEAFQALVPRELVHALGIFVIRAVLGGLHKHCCNPEPQMDAAGAEQEKHAPSVVRAFTTV